MDAKYGCGYCHRKSIRELKPEDLYKKYTKRYMNSSVILPSQAQSYNVCVEFAKDWFLEKFPENYFNSIYVEGKYSYDEFRKFSKIDEQLKKTNPILAIVPTINIEHSRDWIDSSPEIPMMLRRSKMEGCFFNDEDKAIHLQIIFKTILMNFSYKIRLDTKSEQLDMAEFIKLKHRAGYTETRTLSLDMHVPKEIIAQIAIDNGFSIDENLNIKDPFLFINYLNSHSLIPFIYKLRYDNGNNEFFIRVPNCHAHIKCELPSIDDGERDNMITTNYNVDFSIEVEMLSPYCYNYFSQKEQKCITGKPINVDGTLTVMKYIKTDVPDFDEHHWELFTTTEYLVEEDDLKKPLVIDFNEFFAESDLKLIMEYTKSKAINPACFINFKFYNDGIERIYDVDWGAMKCMICNITNITTVIAVYCDLNYINNTLNYLKSNDKRIQNTTGRE